MIVRPITPDLVAAFVPTMDNRKELETLAGMDAEAALSQTVARSAYTFAGVTDGPIFLGGVMGVPQATYGRVWMLANDGVAKARKFYLRATRAQTNHMLTLFPVLFTTVDASYRRSLRWLEWLGFTIGAPLTRDGRTIHVVELRR